MADAQRATFGKVGDKVAAQSSSGMTALVGSIGPDWCCDNFPGLDSALEPREGTLGQFLPGRADGGSSRPRRIPHSHLQAWCPTAGARPRRQSSTTSPGDSNPRQIARSTSGSDHPAVRHCCHRAGPSHPYPDRVSERWLDEEHGNHWGRDRRAFRRLSSGRQDRVACPGTERRTPEMAWIRFDQSRHEWRFPHRLHSG